MQQYFSNSYLFGGNAPYVEELYEAYLLNPGAVPDNWRAYFDAMQHVPAVDGSDRPDVPHASVVASFAEREVHSTDTPFLQEEMAMANAPVQMSEMPAMDDQLLAELQAQQTQPGQPMR